MLIVDSREKWTHPNSTDYHIRKYLERHGIAWEVRKLNVGDYMLDDNPDLAIDKKQNLDEVSRNLMNRNDSSRFWREVRRAHADGIKLVILNDVPKWRSKYSPVTGRRLINEMIRCEMAYGVTWQFCDKRSTARRILEILEYPSTMKGVK